MCLDAIAEYLDEKESPIIHDAKEIKPHRLNMIGADTLLAKQFECLHTPVDGMIVEGLTLMCGASKIGKSWLVLSMCCAVAGGVPFLGRLTEQGDVLYMALEDSERRLKQRLMQLNESPCAALKFATKCCPLDSGLLEELLEWVQSVRNPRMIVIDTLQRIRGTPPARSNAYAVDYAAMGKLKSFADSNHIAVVLVHHLNKMRDVSDPYDRISGSTGLMGAADTTVLISRERDSDDATVSYIGRDVWGDEFSIRFQDGRWVSASAEALERERYERNPLVTVCRRLLQETFDGEVRISLQDFKEVAAERFGLVVAATTNELKKKLKELEPMMKQYDDVQLFFDKRINSKTGIFIVKKKTSTCLTAAEAI